jgi:hypothetical protein
MWGVVALRGSRRQGWEALGGSSSHASAPKLQVGSTPTACHSCGRSYTS